MTTTTISKQEELANINTIQNAIRETGAQWTAGTTSVSNLSAKDKRIMAGGRISPYDASIPLISIPEGVGEFPPTFDWRNKDNKNWMTSIKDQGVCGSCWAFSASGVIEAGFNIYNNDSYLNIDISEQHLVSDCCNAGDCKGGWPDLALKYTRDTGVPDESCFPYIQENTACTPCSDWQDRVYKITGYTQANHTTDSYKQALIDYGPIASCILVPDDWYYYKSGIYEPTLALDVSEWATHAISIVGWDDSDECWFIRNSWGQRWGEDGYGRVKYGNIEKWGYAYAVTGIVYEQPNIVATNITTIPSTCEEPCDIAIDITWKNAGTTSKTFTPGYTINGTLYQDEPVTLYPGRKFSAVYTANNLPSGNYEICPTNN